eukprot:1161868-Pelagomonas_calceolata.AAC.18
MHCANARLAGLQHALLKRKQLDVHCANAHLAGLQHALLKRRQLGMYIVQMRGWQDFGMHYLSASNLGRTSCKCVLGRIVGCMKVSMTSPKIVTKRGLENTPAAAPTC